MTTGGYFGYHDPGLDDKIDDDNDDDYIDDYDDEQEVNRTHPFQPGSASMPYHGGEQHEMQTMQHENTGLPDTSYAEDPLLSSSDPIGNLQQESLLRQKMKKAVDMIRGKFPKADFEKIKIQRGQGKAFRKIVAIGSKGGQYKILKDNRSDFTKSFLDSFKDKLGPIAEQILSQDRNSIQEQHQRLEEAEKQPEAETIAAEREKELREIEI